MPAIDYCLTEMARRNPAKAELLRQIHRSLIAMISEAVDSGEFWRQAGAIECAIEQMREGKGLTN